MKIIFSGYPEILAGLSERSDGSMVWWNKLPVDEAVRANREQYFKKLKIDPGLVVAGGIAHGTNVSLVGQEAAGKYLLNTDALITNVQNIFLTVTAADCLPIFCFDPVTKGLGMIHASWHCLIGGILEKAIKKMNEEFSAQPENIQVVIGPHIGSCHYEVGGEVAARFDQKNIEQRGGQLFADLGGEAELRLRNSGVKNILSSLECTYDNPEKFFSARRDKIDPTQGMLAYLGRR